MKIETIAQIVETSKYTTISAAAEHTYIRQASLSALIQNAEAELGYQIFTRTRSGIQLTSNGKEFIRLAVGLLETYQSIQSLGNTLDESTSLTLLINPLSSERFATDIVCKTNSAFPNISIITRQEFRENIVEKISNGEYRYAVDYVFSYDREQYLKSISRRNLNCKFLLEDTRYLYIGPDSPLYKKEVIYLEDLTSAKLVATPTGEREIGSSGVRNYIRNMTVLSNSQMVKLAVQNRGMCSFYMINTPGEDWITKNSDIRKTILVDETVTAWHTLISSKNISMSKVEKHFLNDIVAVISN